MICDVSACTSEATDVVRVGKADWRMCVVDADAMMHGAAMFLKQPAAYVQWCTERGIVPGSGGKKAEMPSFMDQLFGGGVRFPVPDEEGEAKHE